MQYIFVIPFFISLYMVMRGNLIKAFLNVYLPCTFLLPYYYDFRFPHLPPVSVGEAALIPIGVALLFRPMTAWKFKRMDLWVLLFMVSMAMSELTREESPKDGMILWISNFLEMGLAYIVGRQLMEPAVRLETIKRIVMFQVCLLPFGLLEWRLGQNLWLNAASRFFGLYHVGWFVQLRGGHARISVCYGHAIVAGMFFMVGIAFSYYLTQLYKSKSVDLGPWMSKLMKYRIPMIALPLLLFLTGSRGPMACTVLVFLIMQIPRFKNMKAAAIVITLIILSAFAGVYTYLNRYTAQVTEESDEAQKSAYYRKELLTNYAPILEQGGWLGWGFLSRPIVPGQFSIDNNYMMTQLGQGKLGVYLMWLITVDGIYSSLVFAFKFKSRKSLFLVFSFTGIVIGLFVSLTTVVLAEQMIQFLFLFLGWSQSLVETQTQGEAVAALPQAKFQFRRVIA